MALLFLSFIVFTCLGIKQIDYKNHGPMVSDRLGVVPGVKVLLQVNPNYYYLLQSTPKRGKKKEHPAV